MEIVVVDGIRFNADAVKQMAKETFVKEHVSIGTKKLKLSPEKAEQWVVGAFDIVTGKVKKQKEVQD